MERKKRGQTAASLASGHPGESSRIVTGGVSGANPMTGFKVGMGGGVGNNNTQSQSKVPLSNTPHLHLLPRHLSGRRSRLRSLARSLRVSAISSLVYPVKEPVGRREWGKLALRLDNILVFTT